MWIHEECESGVPSCKDGSNNGFQWVDPDELDSWLDDELEHELHTFFVRNTYAAASLGSMFNISDDQLLSQKLDEDDPADSDADLTARKLKRLSLAAYDCYIDTIRMLDSSNIFRDEWRLVGHLLRELDSIIRGMWWELTCFSDSRARACREAAKQDSRDTPYKGQIDILSWYISLNSDEIQTWKDLGSTAHVIAHRRDGSKRPSEEDELVSKYLDLLPSIAAGIEKSYGLVVVLAARLIREKPNKRTNNILKNHFPSYPPLRKWFLGQISDPVWLRPLYKAKMLLPADSLYMDQTGNPIAPTCPGSRMVARVVDSTNDIQLIKELVDHWLTISNPRLHADVVQILISCRKSVYLDYVEALCSIISGSYFHGVIVRLVGDLGVLRFPSQMLRLAVRAYREQQTVTSEKLIDSVAETLYKNSYGNDLESQVELSLRGARMSHSQELQLVSGRLWFKIQDRE